MKTVRRMAAWLVLGALVLALPVAAQQQQQPPQPQKDPSQGQPSGTGQSQPGFTLGQTQPTPEETQAAQQILQTNDPEQRLALIRDFLAKYPESSYRGAVYAAAALAYRQQNNYAKVIEYGEQAIPLIPNHVLTLVVVADALAESAAPGQPDYKEKLGRAENYAQRALEILPQQAANLRPGVSEEDYKREQKRLEGMLHGIIGYVYLRRGDNAKAEEELILATTLSPTQPDAIDFQRLGLAHLRQQEYKEAESAFQRCVELAAPVSPECQKRLDDTRKRQASQPATEEKKPQP